MEQHVFPLVCYRPYTGELYWASRGWNLKADRASSTYLLVYSPSRVHSNANAVWSLACKSFRSAYSKRVCVRPHILRKLRTYEVSFANDAWRTPPDATALSMASSDQVTHPYRVSARLALHLWCCAIVLFLPLRAHPYGSLCDTRVSV